MVLSHGDFVIRILVGALLGGIIGYERDIHGRAAGLRTHFIVALASATFMVLSAHFMEFQSYEQSTYKFVEADASRIAASVVSGIGFLAGGVILRNGISIQGLTTAAGLWLVSAVGLCSGAGMFLEAILVTFLGVLALTFLRKFEHKHHDTSKCRVFITTDSKSSNVSHVIESIQSWGIKVGHLDYISQEDDKTKISIDLQVPHGLKTLNLIEKLEALEHFKKLQIQTQEVW